MEKRRKKNCFHLPLHEATATDYFVLPSSKRLHNSQIEMKVQRLAYFSNYVLRSALKPQSAPQQTQTGATVGPALLCFIFYYLYDNGVLVVVQHAGGDGQ